MCIYVCTHVRARAHVHMGVCLLMCVCVVWSWVREKAASLCDCIPQLDCAHWGGSDLLPSCRQPRVRDGEFATPLPRGFVCVSVRHAVAAGVLCEAGAGGRALSGRGARWIQLRLKPYLLLLVLMGK